jgi:hypothetical protein
MAHLSKQPGEAAFDAVVLDAVAELAGVGDACRGVGAEREIQARVDQGAIFGEVAATST